MQLWSLKIRVLNAVKNKLLARVVAVVNKQEEYVKKVAWNKLDYVIEIGVNFIKPN